MRSRSKNPAWLPGLLSVCLVLAGCSSSDRSDNTAAMAQDNSPAAQTLAARDGTNVDNTANNTRDRDHANLTPLDQGNSSYDRHLTAQIRQALVNGPANYSTLARNIKIITRDGTVTLRGPVQNDNEKSSIETVAKSIAGNTNVDDLLEVKAISNPNSQ